MCFVWIVSSQYKGGEGLFSFFFRSNQYVPGPTINTHFLALSCQYHSFSSSSCPSTSSSSFSSPFVFIVSQEGDIYKRKPINKREYKRLFLLDDLSIPADI